MYIKEILKGTKIGNIQTVGIMQIIPLLSEIEFPNYVSPKQSGIFGNNNYGSMTFSNTSDSTMIIPNNTTYITKLSAQDHAMMHAGILKGKEINKTYNTAACVEETQGGYVKPDNHEFVILPFSLRERAMEIRREQKYSKLWPSISQFNLKNRVQRGRGAHLQYFFNKFDKELDEFVAEFEIVPKQIGAIILINGIVVGIERSPNYDYWKSIWNQLIRGCYGALSIEKQNTNSLDEKSVEKIRTRLNLKNIKNLSDLSKELENTEKHQNNKVKDIVKRILNDNLKTLLDETVAVNSRKQVNSEQFSGQIIQESAAVVYASLVTKNNWVKNSKWYDSKDFEL